ncbi:MAG TPA: DtxR family transcriptional regulator [Actinobacteria bacterium]|nr:DtxR family transcriptional regulator [Actinomycetota bacterium]
MPKHAEPVSAGTAEPPNTTESEEMYLITVARAIESGHPEPVPMPAIAEALSVSVASANEMVRKLANRELVTYEPYRGAGLTMTGRIVANRVLRTRRLWATFLVEHLGFAPIEADDQACHLEHVTAIDAADRLAAFLGNPQIDPLGQPIPEVDSLAPERRGVIALDQIPVGLAGEVVAMRLPPATRDFLAGEGIAVGAHLAVVAAGESGVLVETAAGPLNLIRRLAAGIDLRAIGRAG